MSLPFLIATLGLVFLGFIAYAYVTLSSQAGIGGEIGRGLPTPGNARLQLY